MASSLRARSERAAPGSHRIRRGGTARLRAVEDNVDGPAVTGPPEHNVNSGQRSSSTRSSKKTGDVARAPRWSHEAQSFAASGPSLPCSRNIRSDDPRRSSCLEPSCTAWKSRPRSRSRTARLSKKSAAPASAPLPSWCFVWRVGIHVDLAEPVDIHATERRGARCPALEEDVGRSARCGWVVGGALDQDGGASPGRSPLTVTSYRNPSRAPVPSCRALVCEGMFAASRRRSPRETCVSRGSPAALARR